MGKSASKLCTECLVPIYKKISKEKIQPVNLEPILADDTPKSCSKDEFFSLEYLGIQDTDELNDNSSESNSILSIMNEAKNEFLDYANAPMTSEDCELMIKTNDILIYGKDTSDGFLIKSEYLIPYSGREFIDFFMNIEERPKWDTNVSEIKLISQSAENV